MYYFLLFVFVVWVAASVLGLIKWLIFNKKDKQTRKIDIYCTLGLAILFILWLVFHGYFLDNIPFKLGTLLSYFFGIVICCSFLMGLVSFILWLIFSKYYFFRYMYWSGVIFLFFFSVYCSLITVSSLPIMTNNFPSIIESD